MSVKRFSQGFLRALSVLALSSAGSLLRAQGAARTVEIAGNDSMKYSVTTFQAAPGEPLTVKLTSRGTMPKIAMAHNFVLLKPGTDAESFAKAALSARATNYIPLDSRQKVIAATALAGNGQTVDVTFRAPADRGTYTYICTFPGHALAGMKGTLVVR